MSEIVYILTNESMPGLVKIGRSEQDIRDRIKQLDVTGVPLPFECFAAYEVMDSRAVEKAFHIAFGDHRVREKREFFRISPDKPAAFLKLIGTKNVTLGNIDFEDEDDRRAVVKEKERRSGFRFSFVGIQAGAVLHSVFDDDAHCIVVDDRKVDFRGSVTSLSKSAMILAKESGYDWTTIAGPNYWKFEDQTLADLRASAGMDIDNE